MFPNFVKWDGASPVVIKDLTNETDREGDRKRRCRMEDIDCLKIHEVSAALAPARGISPKYVF